MFAEMLIVAIIFLGFSLTLIALAALFFSYYKVALNAVAGIREMIKALPEVTNGNQEKKKPNDNDRLEN